MHNYLNIMWPKISVCAQLTSYTRHFAWLYAAELMKFSIMHLESAHLCVNHGNCRSVLSIIMNWKRKKKKIEKKGGEKKEKKIVNSIIYEPRTWQSSLDSAFFTATLDRLQCYSKCIPRKNIINVIEEMVITLGLTLNINYSHNNFNYKNTIIIKIIKNKSV